MHNRVLIGSVNNFVSVHLKSNPSNLDMDKNWL